MHCVPAGRDLEVPPLKTRGTTTSLAGDVLDPATAAAAAGGNDNDEGDDAVNDDGDRGDVVVVMLTALSACMVGVIDSTLLMPATAHTHTHTRLTALCPGLSDCKIFSE